jgi:uncharacterized membrane protein
VFRVTLYSRKDCKLCDQALSDLEALQDKIPHELIIVDIDEEPELLASYGERVPVVEAGPYKLDAPFDLRKLEVTIGAARDRADQNEEIGGKRHRSRQARSRTFSRGDRITYWLSRRYLLVINVFLLLYFGLPFLAPVFMNAGLPGLARPIYTVYGAVCHQLAFRSWFLFGDQPAYPRAKAGVEGLVPYGEATGQNENALLEARRYTGDESVGYKVAFCERDVAIYAAMFVFGLIYAMSKRRIPALPWYMWFVIGIAPIAIDGFSQLLSQLPGFTLWEYRESTPLLRTLTGGLFGFTTAWFGFPVVDETMAETRTLLAAKLARIKKSMAD